MISFPCCLCTLLCTKINSEKKIHLISYGAANKLYLGNRELNLKSIIQEESQLKNWSKAFSERAVIFLYGCHVASSSEGIKLINKLNSLTGAVIVSLVTATGNQKLGGNWQLEVETKEIEVPMIFN